MNLKSQFIKIKKIGLIDKEIEFPFLTDEPKIPYFLCSGDNKSKYKYDINEVHGQGFDLDKDLAKIKAVAEFYERLCLYNPPLEKLKHSEYNNNDSFINPYEFRCYSSKQVDIDEYKSRCIKSEYKWWPVKELTEGRNVFIPAQLIFLSSCFNNEFEIRGEQITTGTAFGNKDSTEALERALLEIVERDSCMGFYLQKKKIPKIIHLPEKLSSLIEYLNRYELEPNIFDITSDIGIPSILVITLDKTGRAPAVNTGSKSAFELADAIEGAILESIQCRRYPRLVGMEDIVEENKINSMEDRFHYWKDLIRISDINFWVNDTRCIEFENIKYNSKLNFEKSLELFREKKYRVFLADITIPEIAQQGFEVVKMVIPELHPLFLSEGAKMLYSVHYGEINSDNELKPHFFT